MVISAVIVAVLATGTVVASAQSSGSGTIGKAKAKEEALRAVNGVVEDIDLEVERGRLIYEVEVQRPDYKDDTTILIDARTGELIAVYEDDDLPRSSNTTDKAATGTATSNVEGNTASSNGSTSTGTSSNKQNQVTSDNSVAAGTKPADNKQANSSTANSSSSNSHTASSNTVSSKATMITLEQAKRIAQNTVKGTIVDADLDRDDGVTKYEFDIRTDEGKVELDIDAYSGKVLSQKLDRDDDWDDDDDRYEDDDLYDDDWDDLDDDLYDDDRYED